MTAPWWRSAVFYQIYPRSFAPGHGGPTGDLAGIEAHLDHLSWLGVDAVWVSPFFPSPQADFGYDVADFCDVDPTFGDLAAFDRLLGACHDRGIRLLVDLVPNHTSDQHPWFTAARSSRDDPKRDWYIWRDGTPDAPPNNWIAAFSPVPAWTWDDVTRQWYLHQFLPEQPDLNWANPEVVEAMHDVMRFWLDRGVDGFRIDVVHGLGKEPGLPDDPPEAAGLPHCIINDVPQTHELIRGMRKLVDAYPGDRLILGEVYLLSTEQVAPYYGDDDELHLSFNFPPLFTPWTADRWREQIADTHRLIDDRGAWATWVLSNHDNARHRTRYASEDRARAALFLLLGLRGSPVLYAGEELGLEDAVIPPDRVVDPGGRDGCRAPIPWTGAPDHGWGVTDAWLPWPPGADTRNAEALVADETSIAHLYRRLLAARKASPALRLGDFAELGAPAGVVAWRRTDPDGVGDDRVVAVNMGAEPALLDVHGTVLVSSDGAGEGAPFAGTLGPDRAVLMAATTLTRMVTLDDVARIALDLPEVTEGERHGNLTWSVAGKGFAWERPFSKADIRRFGDAAPPEGPILAVRVEDLSEKEAVLAAQPDAFLTIPHFEGYSAVLIQLRAVTKRALREAIIDGWLACAPPELANDYIARGSGRRR